MCETKVSCEKMLPHERYLSCFLGIKEGLTSLRKPLVDNVVGEEGLEPSIPHGQRILSPIVHYTVQHVITYCNMIYRYAMFYGVLCKSFVCNRGFSGTAPSVHHERYYTLILIYK